MERDKETELSVEECQYFTHAVHYIWAHGAYRQELEDGIIVEVITVVWGQDVREILKKTDEGWDWIDFERFKKDPQELQNSAYKISKKLSVPEIKIIREIMRKQKRLVRRLGYARRPKVV